VGLLTAVRAGALLVAALVAVLPAAPAAAGPSFGLRLGWASAVGSAAAHVPMSEEVAWQVPIQAEALWRLPWGAPAPRAGLSLGLYGSYAPAGLTGAGSTPCADGASCSAQAIRAGAQALWTFAPWVLDASPWIGAGAGWEWTSQRRERLDATTSTRWNGPELSIQGGAAWRLGSAFALGPYGLVGLGWYRDVGIETPVESASASIGARAVHAWIHLGVRGTFDVEL
jgi:hypothetical protein